VDRAGGDDGVPKTQPVGRREIARGAGHFAALSRSREASPKTAPDPCSCQGDPRAFLTRTLKGSEGASTQKRRFVSESFDEAERGAFMVGPVHAFGGQVVGVEAALRSLYSSSRALG